MHPIGPDSFPGQPEGWRWAIHTSSRFEQWTEGVLNAGQEQSRGDAEAVLSMVLITLRRGLHAANVPCEVAANVLTDCPLNPVLAAELAVLI